MMAPGAPCVDAGVSAVQGGAASWPDLARRLAPSGERAAPRPRALASRPGLRSPARRTHSWPWADVSGATPPDALPHLRRRALWDPEAVCEARRRDVRHQLADPNAVLVLDETGWLKQGRHAAGVACQDRGTAGRVEPCQSGVWLGSASPLGPTVLDRERSLPQEWTDAHDRYPQAGIAEDQRVATTPPLARPMVPRARAPGIPAPWVTGDRVSGEARRLRRWLAAQPPASVLAGSGTESVWWNWRPRPVQTSWATRPEDGGTRLSASDGATGPRGDDWRGRRRGRDPSARRGAVVLAP